MLRLLLHWILNAVALLVVAHFVAGFEVKNFVSALIAVVVIGLFNATLGLFLKIITLPLGILSFGIVFPGDQCGDSVVFEQVCAGIRGRRRSRRLFLERWRWRCCICCSGSLATRRRGSLRLLTRMHR